MATPFQVLGRSLGVILFTIAEYAVPGTIDLSEYSKVTYTSTASPFVGNSNMNAGSDGWTLPDGFRWEASSGRSGSGCIAYERTDTNLYTLAFHDFALSPGIRYRFGAWVRTENVTGSDNGATICVQYYDENKKYKGGAYPVGIKGTQDWKYIEGDITTPATSYNYQFVLYLRREMKGKAWFDDISIRQVEPLCAAYLIEPSMGIPSTGATLFFGVQTYGVETSIFDPAKLACSLTLIRDGKTLQQHFTSVVGDRAAMSIGPLAPGKAHVQITVIETNRKLICKEEMLPITVVAPARSVPTNACIIDARGRALVGGKPFLPIGLYLMGVTKADIERTAQSPFNCILPYRSLKLRFDGSTTDCTGGVREVLGLCHARGLKMIFSLKDVFSGTQWAVNEFCGATNDASIVEKAVVSFRDHPSLLAWYINDELPSKMLARLVSRRHEVSDLDPFHPTFAVVDQFDELPIFGGTCDIIGVDPYPIWDANSRDMKKVVHSLDMARKARSGADGMAAWVVPQAFNYGVYEGKTREEMLAKFRDPSEEEMRSMSLVSAILGTRGFIYFSYHDLFKPMTMADSERRWGDLCRVGALMTNLAPFLLSDKTAPAIAAKTENGKVLAKGYSDEHGRVRVLVCAVGPGDSKAVVSVPGFPNLKSRFGKCENLGGGNYRFLGKDIASDVLMDE